MAFQDARSTEFQKLDDEIWNSQNRAGNWFRASTRRNIALSAKAALVCPCCCKVGGEIYVSTQELFSLNKDCTQHETILASDPAAAVLIPIVHTIANFQNLIDESWVSKTLLLLKQHFYEVEGIPDLDALDISSAYCEIVTVAALSIGLGMMQEHLHMSQSQAVPYAATDVPKRIRLKQLLKRVRRDSSTGYLPYFYGSDLVFL
jgi:hypothetical protein